VCASRSVVWDVPSVQNFYDGQGGDSSFPRCSTCAPNFGTLIWKLIRGLATAQEGSRQRPQPAAFSGSLTKAPRFAGGYLLMLFAGKAPAPQGEVRRVAVHFAHAPELLGKGDRD
jgi:hypothetical protein